ncbi:hypothetical protein O181_129484, partial [Austropuccinia psidii MF-1]|nr:hypothetical protein [Austropuccinia psidii MF-1]
RNHIKSFAHITSNIYKLCSKDVVFEITKERRDAHERIKHELTNATVLILPEFELPFKLYIDAALSQVLGAFLHKRQILDGEPREGVIHYISRQLKDSEARYGEAQTECLFLVWALGELHYYLEGQVSELYTYWAELKSLLNMKTANRNMLGWQIAMQDNRDDVNRHPTYDPEVAVKIPIHFMEKNRRKNFRFSEWAPESGAPESEDSESEGTDTHILGIGSSELHNDLFSEVIKTYAKHKQCGILLQLLQQEYRRHNWNPS